MSTRTPHSCTVVFALCFVVRYAVDQASTNGAFVSALAWHGWQCSVFDKICGLRVSPSTGRSGQIESSAQEGPSRPEGWICIVLGRICLVVLQILIRKQYIVVVAMQVSQLVKQLKDSGAFAVDLGVKDIFQLMTTMELDLKVRST